MCIRDRIYKVLSSNPEIDYLGIDYIRPFEGGYETIDKFVQEMGIEVPDEWTDWPFKERMLWLVKKIENREDLSLAKKWNWWRARTGALILKRIKEEAKITRPFFAFMLTWKRGWQHGQDPVMLTQAGADYLGLMLYEASREQFDTLIKDWHNYIERDDANLIVGDVLDWPLHQLSREG